METDNFVLEIENIMSDYIDLLEEYNVSKQLVTIIKEYRHLYERILNEYLLGHNNESYKLYKKYYGGYAY